MEVRQYLAALRKGWWLIVIAVIVGIAGGALINLRSTPQYESSVTFFISTPSQGGTTALAADQFATRRITSYEGLLNSDVVAQRIIETADLDLTVADVKSRIAGDTDLNTVLLTATVTDSSAERSFLITSAIASQFGAIVNQVDPIGPENVVLRVVSGPTLNPDPVSPRTTVNLAAGLVAGLLLGIGLAVLRQMLDTRIHQPQVIRDITDAPVLGVIPFERTARKSPLIVNALGRSVRAEALRQLRTNLQFVDVERPVSVLVVTSSVAGEGKSTTAVNLALSFAEYRRSVLLIEADLRRPRVADYLGLDRTLGLTNVLAGQVVVDEVLQSWGDAGLVVLPSGSIPPNPSELLGSPAMLELLKLLRTRFDMIVIDTPPLLPVTDGAVAAAFADGAVLVVRYGKTKRAQIAAAARSLKSVDARLLGSILNMAPAKGSDGYGSYNYGYYEEDGKKNAKKVDETPQSMELRSGQAGDGQSDQSPRSDGAGAMPDTQNGATTRRALRMKPKSE